MKRFLPFLFAAFLPFAALGQTSPGQVLTFQGPSLGQQWVLPSANTAGYGTGVAAWLATPSSANLATAVTNETGSGVLVFGTNPTLSTPHLTTPMTTQGAPHAATTSATLTAAQVATGIITVNEGAGAASALQLPLASAMDTQFSTAAAGDSVQVCIINISVVDAEDASVTTNTGWTLVGSMDWLAYNAAGTRSSGCLRLRKTGTAAWTAYRIN